MMNENQFIKKFSEIYENSQWIVEAVWNHGLEPSHNNIQNLHSAMVTVVESAGLKAQRTLLNQHPDLAGKLAAANKLTSASESEQNSAGLNNCTTAELRKIQHLNLRYKKKFGFPFILAVRGRNVPEVISIFENRIKNNYDQEFRESLNQVHKIALLRLREVYSQ